MKSPVCLGLLIVILFTGRCTSGTAEQNTRNSDIFGPAAQNIFTDFTATALSFDGNIQALTTTINALAASGSSSGDSVIADTIIEGIVIIPSNVGIGIGTAGCTATNSVYARSFILQDGNAGILVAYGLEPPIADVAQSASMKYINNARNSSLAIFGDRLRITAKRAQKFGSGANVIPVVTDFANIVLVSSRNSVPYASQSTAFTRAADLYRVRRIDGYITTEPDPTTSYCLSGDTRQFQFNYQQGYSGTICVGATSVSDAGTCTGGKVPMKFQLSENLGVGTLTGFDTGNSFSYTLKKNAKVRLTGPIFPPQYNQPDTNLTLMLDKKFQVETLK